MLLTVLNHNVLVTELMFQMVVLVQMVFMMITKMLVVNNVMSYVEFVLIIILVLNVSTMVQKDTHQVAILFHKESIPLTFLISQSVLLKFSNVTADV